MPGKTLSDRMLELEKLTTALGQTVELFRFERGDIVSLRERLSILENEVHRLKDLPDLKERLATLETRLHHIEKQQSEDRGKRWAVVLAMISALIGSAITILVQLLLSRPPSVK